MKKLSSLLILSLVLLFGAGCETQKNQENQVGNNKTPPQTTQVGTKLYSGSWFDIQYPENFIPRPTTPAQTDNGINYIETDEAYFTSPDKTVEFFVFSPLWSQELNNYLNIAPTEELIKEKTEESNLEAGKRITRSATIKAKDGSYFRSFVSITDQTEAGGGLQHIFGIKYRDDNTYATHQDAYTSFQESLQQYAD